MSPFIRFDIAQDIIDAVIELFDPSFDDNSPSVSLAETTGAFFEAIVSLFF
jgi:hypothetical protein